MDCCYPVKCLAGHYGELIHGQKKKIDILFSPMILSLPSFLGGSVDDSLSCPRVMAAPENIRSGFQREGDIFERETIKLVSPVVALAERRLASRQLFVALSPVMAGLTPPEMDAAVAQAYDGLSSFDSELRVASKDILRTCFLEGRSCVLVLARPYHMDPGIGHEIETEIQSEGYPILWSQYLPLDADLLSWAFGDDLRSGLIKSPLDISDVWKSSYSANTNELLWSAKFAARMPWISCVIRMSSYECGMDQPTYSPVQAIVEESGTLFFSFQDLDANKPTGSLKIRTETISHYLGKHAGDITLRKSARFSGAPPF